MTALVTYDAARTALAKATTIDDAKDIRDKAEALKAYARQRNNVEMERWVAEIRLRATVRIGELSAELETAQGTRKDKHSNGAVTKLEALQAAGLTKMAASRAERLAENHEAVERYIADQAAKKKPVTLENALTAAARELKAKKQEARRAKNRALVRSTSELATLKGVFATIVVDPPWDWGDEGDATQLGRGRHEYAAMPLHELLELPVGERADVDCHLYLWITNRSLPKGFQLIERWGFRYVTCLTWVKPSFGMGNYFRGQTEHVLFGIKGSQQLKRKDVGTVFMAPRGAEHSSKPIEFFELIESCSPGPYLQVFARGSRAEWVYWGAEADAA